jgi:thymidylate kinase
MFYLILSPQVINERKEERKQQQKCASENSQSNKKSKSPYSYIFSQQHLKK